jgi:pimeloyl-ACP methyl ester carboxylesterase
MMVVGEFAWRRSTSLNEADCIFDFLISGARCFGYMYVPCLFAPFSFIANPVQGTKDAVFSVANATEEIQLFTQSPDARLVPVDGGAHFLNCTHASEVNKALVDFVSKYK